MIDIVSPQKRSEMMAGIRGKNTRPEVAVRKALHARGFRFRLHPKELPGKPDIVLARYRAVIFVNGCFWHRHDGCRLATVPATNPDFWQAKFAANVSRDRLKHEKLRDMGWRIAIVWECAQRSLPADEIGEMLAEWLKSDSPAIEI